MDEWTAVEDAVRRERWSDATAGVRALLDAWREVKRAVLWFASEELEREAERFEATLSMLVTLLERDPIDVSAVHTVLEQVRALAGAERGC